MTTSTGSECETEFSGIKKMLNLNQRVKLHRDVLFEFHLKFFNTASIGFPARSLL